MVIKAKYTGRCRRCSGTINVGDEIEWERGKGARHVSCPAQEAEGEDVATFGYARGSGYGYGPYTVGEMVHRAGYTAYDGTEVPEAWGVVIKASRTYYREDGLSFGVGDESGYRYSCVCRYATPDEIAAKEREVAEAKAEQGAAKAEALRLEEIISRFRREGERPDGMNTPEGERILDTQDIYGGGDWFVLGVEWIWYIRNNGRDGDDWSLNNVRTGGAGAIGWRLPYTPQLESEVRSFQVERSEHRGRETV